MLLKRYRWVVLAHERLNSTSKRRILIYFGTKCSFLFILAQIIKVTLVTLSKKTGSLFCGKFLGHTILLNFRNWHFLLVFLRQVLRLSDIQKFWEIILCRVFISQRKVDLAVIWNGLFCCCEIFVWLCRFPAFIAWFFVRTMTVSSLLGLRRFIF